MDTGITRRIDHLGRIVIPAETRRIFNIKEGDELSFGVRGDAIVIRKVTANCTFCGSPDQLREFRGKGVCQECAEGLTSAS